jgi:hypothetical protein
MLGLKPTPIDIAPTEIKKRTAKFKRIDGVYVRKSDQEIMEENIRRSRQRLRDKHKSVASVQGRFDTIDPNVQRVFEALRGRVKEPLEVDNLRKLNSSLQSQMLREGFSLKEIDDRMRVERRNLEKQGYSNRDIDRILGVNVGFAQGGYVDYLNLKRRGAAAVGRRAPTGPRRAITAKPESEPFTPEFHAKQKPIEKRVLSVSEYIALYPEQHRKTAHYKFGTPEKTQDSFTPEFHVTSRSPRKNYVHGVASTSRGYELPSRAEQLQMSIDSGERYKNTLFEKLSERYADSTDHDRSLAQDIYQFMATVDIPQEFAPPRNKIQSKAHPFFGIGAKATGSHGYYHPIFKDVVARTDQTDLETPIHEFGHYFDFNAMKQIRKNLITPEQRMDMQRKYDRGEIGVREFADFNKRAIHQIKTHEKYPMFYDSPGVGRDYERLSHRQGPVKDILDKYKDQILEHREFRYGEGLLNKIYIASETEMFADVMTGRSKLYRKIRKEMLDSLFPTRQPTVKGYKLGGQVDNIPASLTAGEYVVNADATKKHIELLEAINSNRYQFGGVVGDRPQRAGQPTLTIGSPTTQSSELDMTGLNTFLTGFTTVTNSFATQFENIAANIESYTQGLATLAEAIPTQIDVNIGEHTVNIMGGQSLVETLGKMIRDTIAEHLVAEGERAVTAPGDVSPKL